MKKQNIKRGIIILSILLFIIIATFYINFLLKPYVSEMRIRGFIDKSGISAPFVFILIQAAQAIFPILPAYLIILTSGILFGVVYGSIYSLIGLGIGISLTFFLARKFGRKTVERYINRNEIKKIDEFCKEHGSYAVFFGRLLPLFPNNLFSFGLGLTKISYKRYFAASMLAFLPGVLLLNIFGNSLAKEFFTPNVIILIFFLLVLLFIAHFFKHKIIRYLHKMLLRLKKL